MLGLFYVENVEMPTSCITGLGLIYSLKAQDISAMIQGVIIVYKLINAKTFMFKYTLFLLFKILVFFYCLRVRIINIYYLCLTVSMLTKTLQTG